MNNAPRTETIEYQTPGPEISADAVALLEDVRSLNVDSPQMKTYAASQLQDVKARAAALEEKRTAITGPLHKAMTAVNALFREPAALLASAEAALKQKILAYDARVEQERRAEEARLAEIARKERAELEARAAAERAKADAAAAELRRRSELAAAAGRAAEAAKLAARADSNAESVAAKVGELLERAANVSTAVVLPPPPNVAGLSTRTEWTFEIEHPEQVPDEFKTIDEAKIRGVVRALKSATKIPGVRVFSKPILAARS